MTNDSSRFCVLKSVYIDGVPYKIAHARVSGDDVYLCLSGVSDRNAAELLRGKYLKIDRAAAVPTDEGEFFIDDVVGATLYARGEQETLIGKVVSVQSFGAADVFSVDCADGRGMTFAFIAALDMRLDGKKLSVDGKKLSEVAVYDEN